MPTYTELPIKEEFKYYSQQEGRILFNSPMSFVRLNKWPLDTYSLFRNLSEAWDYVGNPDNPSYPGQILSTYNIDGSKGTAIPTSKADGKYRLYVVTKDTTKPNGLGLREFVGSEDAWRLVNLIPNYNNGTESSTRILNSDISSGPLTFAPGNDNLSFTWTNTGLKNILRISSSDFKVETKNEKNTKFWITGVRQVLDSSITTNVFDPCIYVTANAGEMVVPTMNSSINNVSTLNVSTANIKNSNLETTVITNLKTTNSSITKSYVETERVLNSSILNSSILNSSIGNSYVTNQRVDNASIKKAYIEVERVLNSSIQNSSILNSSIGNSYVTNQRVDNASIKKSYVETERVLNSSILNSSILNSSIGNSYVTNQRVDNASISKVYITNASIDKETVTNSSIANASITNLSSVNNRLDYIQAIDISIGNYSLKEIAEQGPDFYIKLNMDSYYPPTDNPVIIIENPNNALDDEYYISSLSLNSSTMKWNIIPNSSVGCVRNTFTYTSKRIPEYLNSFTVFKTENLECVKTINLDDSSAWYGDIVQSLWPVYEFNDNAKLSYKDLTVGIAIFNKKGRCSNIIAIKFIPKCIGKLADNSYGYEIKAITY